MSSTVLLHDLRWICVELPSDKITSRQKALDKLDYILNNSKNDLIRLYAESTQKLDPTWTNIFNTSVEALFRHAAKIRESEGTKQFQTLRNKNHMYSSVVNKLIDFSLEDNHNFLNTHSILTAFNDGFTNSVVLRSFGITLIQILERGVYDSVENTRSMKVSDVSLILVNLFEMNLPDDESLKLAVIRCKNRTIEICQKYFQIGFDLKQFLPEIKPLADNARDELKQAEVIKLFYLFVSELSVDYHISTCGYIQEILPVLLGYYNFRMKTESKTYFFRSIYVSLKTIYPNLNKGDYNPVGVILSETWQKNTLRRLNAIVELESKEQAIQMQRPNNYKNDDCHNLFIKISAMIVFLWNWNENHTDQGELVESRAKISKNSDKLETLLASTTKENGTINQISLEIFTELLLTQPQLINPSNFVTILESYQRSLLVFTSWANLKCLRFGLSTLLNLEPSIFPTKKIKAEVWDVIVEFLITDTSSAREVLAEKHLLLQDLIRAKKLNLDDCMTLLNFLLINNTMRRNECVATVREIIRYNDNCNLEKTSDIITKLLNWLYQSSNQLDGKSLLLNIEALDEELVADTSTLMVVNFLDNIPFECKEYRIKDEYTTRLLSYKYCRKYICIDEHGAELRKANKSEHKQSETRCLIQSNYELLMRLLNYETSKEASISNINRDLMRLLKMVLVLRKLLDYGIFNESTYTNCPLIKRIGFFIDNVDFQVKSIAVQQILPSELQDIIEIMWDIFNNMCQSKIFLSYLRKQNIEGLIHFSGCILKHSASKTSEDSKELCQKTMKLLALLCSSSNHSQKAFNFIKQQRLNLRENLPLILSMTNIFCQQEQNQEIAAWFVDKLKTLCQLFRNNVEICEQLVEIIPEIVRYVEPFPDELEISFIIISSFLKMSFKKSYSVTFAVKLINSIRQIVKYCPNIITNENFVIICLSSIKFLPSPSIAISFSVVNSVIALMDSNWIKIHLSNMEKYFDFCCKLYSGLDWNSLPMEVDDIKINSTAITIQLLTSLFAFSTFHREVALQELGNFYLEQNLKQSNFYQFSQVASFYGCSLSEFTKPYSDALLHSWTQKKQRMSKFPSFLCAENNEKYFTTHLPYIVFYQLRFSPTEGLEELQRLKYGKNKQLIWKALPICYAYSLSVLSKNTQNPSPNYINEATLLLRNLNELGFNLTTINYKIYWITLYNVVKQLWDEAHFASIFGCNFYSCTPQLFINFVNLKYILRFYLNKCYASSSNLFECVIMLMKSDPMALLNVFPAFKLESSDYIFISDRLKSFYWFCALAEIVVESVSQQLQTFELDSTQTFFLRDILFFILNILSIQKSDEILKAGLYFLHQVLNKHIEAFKELIKKYLNEISCVLVTISQKCESSYIQEMAISLLEMIICQNSTELYESIKLLDQFPDLDVYQNLRKVQRSINENRETELRWVVQDFLNADTKGSVGLKSLKQCIANKKCNFQDISKNSNLLYDLLKRLMEIVRGDDANLAMESAKCLGEIGSVKIENISFYFECDTTFYNMESAYNDEMTFFAESFYRLLDKLLLRYDSASCVEMYRVCKDLANSRVGSRILGSFPLLCIFLEQGQSSILDGYLSIAAFSFLEILEGNENLEYKRFIKSFSSNIFKNCQWESFAELCELNFSFSESAIIPIFKVLLANRQTHFDNIVEMLEHFFQRTFDAIRNEEWKTSRNIYSDKRVIKYFLNICECIRIHNNWIVPINLLNVATACIYCQANFMGILYLEMWALVEKNKTPVKNSELMKNPIFQDIATKAFKSIDCAEAISGFLDPLTSRSEYLNLEGDWSQVLLELDASNDVNKGLYVQNLKRNGLLMLSSSDKFNDKIDYECCWRLGQWETVVDSKSKTSTIHDLEYEFEKNHFNALKSIHNREEVNCMSAIDKARQAIISSLKEISIECLQSIYKYLTWLQMLQQAEDFCQIQFALGPAPETILKKWNLGQELIYGNFNCKELLLSQQITLHKTAGIRAGRKISEFFKDKSAIGECLIKCINECKSAGKTNLAIRNIALLKTIESTDQLKAKALLEDADVCWKTGKTTMAKAILDNVMLNKDFIFCLERIQAHRMYGELLLEANSETFEVVYNEFFLRSIELLDKYSEHRDRVLKSSSFDINEFEAFNKDSRKLAFATIAKYADKEYLQLDTYLNSETFRTKVQIMLKNKENAQSLAKQAKNSANRDKSLGISMILRNCGIDDKEIKMLEQKRFENLVIALENYTKFCQLDNTITSPAIYRIISLWFANKHDKNLYKKFKEIILEIPSYKFLCVFNQMSARLSSKNPMFLQLLETILIKCIEDHPQHTLHKILALVFAYADDPKNTTTSDRVNIAKDIINKVKSKSQSSCVRQMESMFSALIDFANKDSSKSSSLTLTDKVRKLRNLDQVHCVTMELPVAINKVYNLTYIRKWEENVCLVGGINAPKKLMCVCSDGISRPQLLKGKDDLRQDAVMQQVLSMVTDLLNNDPETNDQNLLLRTYKVVPFSMRSGLLEWCENTVPIGFYLCGDKKNEGAHKKYRPKDYLVSKCRSLSMDALKNKDDEYRYKLYIDICKNISPVFHYFFFEKFLIPGIWFERRLAYTKSVATTSIVGYILGLGDRHTQNILIDERTAEVVHIDFGISFEQGKIMPTPETIPFRLTRDIVAPMGVSEADGVFRKSCEKTMKILRKNQVFLTTILEVLLYDPLYVWKWSSQITLDGDTNSDCEGKNLTAQRALLRVQNKLEGKEEGQMGITNVEVQIQRLINEAMNPHNLCRLYPGWDPYL